MLPRHAIVKLGVFGLVLGLLIIGLFVGRDYLCVATLSKLPKTGLLAWMILISITTIMTIAYIPLSPLLVFLGVHMGAVSGMLIATIGMSTGAAITFLLSRYIAHDFFSRRIENRHVLIAKYDHWLSTHAKSTIFYLRFIPVPYNIMTLLLSLSHVRFWDFMIGTIASLMPILFAWTSIGAVIANHQNPRFILGVVLYLIVLAIPIIMMRYKAKHHVS